MMKRIFLGYGLILVSTFAKAQNPVSFSGLSPGLGADAGISPAAAKEEEDNFAAFRFEEEEGTHDFGTIPEGPKVTYVFKFTNTGKQPLIISNAQASCGCTAPEFPREPILPGEKGGISVTYTTQGHPGKFSKSVYLTSNASIPGGTAYYELFIKGVVSTAVKAY